MDSNTFSSSKPNVYHDSFHQALSLRPAMVGVSREVDDRDLFLMAQMHAPWTRADFTEAHQADQPVSSHVYGGPCQSAFQSNIASSPTQPAPLQPCDLLIPIHHQHQRGNFLHLEQQQAAPESPAVASQSTVEPTENSASERRDNQEQTPKKRKQSANPAKVKKIDKRNSHPEEWKKKKKKIQRDRGEEYVTMRGKLQKARFVQPIDCSKCRFRCSEKIPEDVRQAIHNVYWNLASYERQRAFIAQHVEQNDIKQVKSKTSARREVAHSFFFVHKRKEHRVCKSFFTKTLDITHKLVDYTMKKTECGVYVGRDERGRRDPVNKTKPEDADFIRWHIGSFPTVDSSKSKKDIKNPKHYLSHDLNVGKMYRLYKEVCERMGRKAKGISVYRNIFKNDFNFVFQKPKKEHCVNCKCHDGNKKKVKDDCVGRNASCSSEHQTFF